LAKAAAKIKNVDSIINGHITSNPTPFSDLQTYANFNKDFLDWVKAEMKANKTVEQAATEYKIPEKYTGYTSGRGAANDIRIAYTELGGK